MAKGLDDLLRFLVKQIAFQGETGASTSDVADYATLFYKDDTETLTNKDNSQRGLDRAFLKQIWSWLVTHPELHLGPQRDLQRLSLEQVESHNRTVSRSSQVNDPRDHRQPNNSLSSDAVSEIRLYASDEQMWLALTGHGPDYKRVPALEFTCLSVIGAHRAKGIVQPLLVQITGQDKRSVPDRTNQLAEKGYIVKKKVLSQKSATSLCILKQFSGEDLPSSSDLQKYEGSWVRHRFAKHEHLVKEALEVLNERELITWVDLRALLGIPEGTLVGKRVLEAFRRFEYLGCLERVRTVIPTGFTARSYSAGYRAIQSLRPATEEDWIAFYSLKRDNPRWTKPLLKSTDSNEGESSGEDSATDASNNEVVIDESENIPLWSPDWNIANICYRAIQKRGRDGAITSDACDLATGAFCRRSTSGLLQSISNTWHADRPLDLAVLRDAAQLGRKTVFKYYTFRSFKEIVDDGKSSWEAVCRPPPSDLQIVQSELFGKITPSSILSPHATLADCLKPALSSHLRRPVLVPSMRGTSDDTASQKKPRVSAKTDSERLSRGAGTRKYAAQYSEAELKAMPSDKRKKIINSIEMGRRYHRRKLQEMVDQRAENGEEYGDIINEMERNLESLTQKTSDSAVFVKLDLVRETCVKHRNSLYLPSKAAHSKPEILPVQLAGVSSKPSNLKSHGRKRLKADLKRIDYLPSVAAHSFTPTTNMQAGISSRRTYNKRQKNQKLPSDTQVIGIETSVTPVASVRQLDRDNSLFTPLTVESSRQVGDYGTANSPNSNDTDSNNIPAPITESPASSFSRVGRPRKQTAKALGLAEKEFARDQKSHDARAKPTSHRDSTLTYEQQYSFLSEIKSRSGLFLGSTVRLKTSKRGPGPKSLLVVFKSSRLKELQRSFLMGKTNPINNDAVDTICFDNTTTETPPRLLSAGGGNTLTVDSQAHLSSNLREVASEGEGGDVNLGIMAETRPISGRFQSYQSSVVTQQSNAVSDNMRDADRGHSLTSPVGLGQTGRLELSHQDLDNFPSHDAASAYQKEQTSNRDIAEESAVDREIAPTPDIILSVAKNSYRLRAQEKENPYRHTFNEPASTPPIRSLKKFSAKPSRPHSPSQNGCQTDPMPNPPSSLDSNDKDHGKGAAQPMTGISRHEGSAAAAKKKIILDIIAKCDGVFPGEREIWYPFTSEWIRHSGKSKPDTRTIVSLIKQLVEAGKLRKYGFNFETPRNGIKIKYILTLPHISNDDERVNQMKQKIIEYHPRLYIPDSAGVDKAFRRHPETWWTPGQPRHGWGEKMVEGSASILPMPPQISKDIQASGGKTATERLKAWQENLVFKQRMQASTELNENGELPSGETSSYQGRAPKHVDIQAFVAARKKARLQNLLRKADEELGEPSFVVPNYSPRKAFSTSLSNQTPPKQLQSSFQGIKSLSSTDGSALAETVDRAKQDRQKRIDRLAALKMLDSGDLAKSYKVSQSSLPQPQEAKTQYKLTMQRPKVRLPRLPRRGTSIPSNSHFMQEQRYKFAYVGVGRFHRPLDGCLLDHKQTFFTAIGTFGTFLQQPAWFVPGSLEDILSRKWPGKPDDNTNNGPSSVDHFGQLLKSVLDWELNDCIADFVPGNMFPFINISLPSASKKPRRMIVPQIRTLERNLDKAEGVKKRGPSKEFQVGARKRRRRSARIDGYTPQSEKDALLAMIFSRSLFQSGDERYTNWTVVSLLQAGKYEESELKRLWNRLRPTWKTWYDQMKDRFENEFLKAYSAGHLPIIRYDDVQSNDWESLMNWTRELLGPHRPNFDGIFKVAHELPRRREDLTKEYLPISSGPSSGYDIYEIKQRGIRLAKRREWLHLDSFVVDDKMVNFKNDDIDNATIARSWVRANVLTLSQNYHSQEASQKLSSVEELDMDSAVRQLLASKLLISRGKGRDMPGRSFDVSDKFFSNFKTSIDVKVYKQAAAYKHELDDAFRAKGFSQFSFHAGEGCALAVINMLANGSIRAAPIDVKDNPMGHLDAGYRARSADKELFRFDVWLEPTDKYILGNPLLPLPLIPRCTRQENESGVDKTPLPAWIDIHGNNVHLIWEYSLCCLLTAVTVRPGLPVKMMEEYVKPTLESWEIHLLMTWAVNSGAAEWQDAQKTAVTLKEWWWLALDT